MIRVRAVLCNWALGLLLALGAVSPALARDDQPVVILVSIDGFRPDYLDRGVTPNLNRLARGGVKAAMRPAFPSKTFPNHWAMVTGFYPDHNGIVANRIEDATRPGEVFTMATDDPFWWNTVPPIWVDAEKAGIRTATLFWPGSNVAWGGVRETTGWKDVKGGTRPADWVQFNMAVSDEQGINGVLDWLRRPANIRPKLITVYFDEVDTAGHHFGPNDAQTLKAVAQIDHTIGTLVRGIAALGRKADVVIVADHGMAAIDASRTIALDRIVDPSLFRAIETGPFAALQAAPGKDEALAAALLRPHDHMQCWRKGEIPARFHYGRNPRVPAFFCLAETGWMINGPDAKPLTDGGTHGFDNAAPDMAALFVAFGPDFAAGKTLPPFDNVAIAPLLRRLIGLPQAAGMDGTDAPFADVLPPPGRTHP